MNRSAATAAVDQRRSAHLFVSSFLQELSPDACFSAAELIAAHPHLAAAKSAVLDLALEEYCRRESAGEALDAQDFSRQFPQHASSVLHLLQLRRYFEAHSRLPASGAIAWPEVGDSLLGYVLLEELGRGSQSRVFLATQIDIGERLVVLKITPNHVAEVQALGRLAHPKIVPIHSLETDRERGVAVICMPYLGAATLLDVLYIVQDSGGAPRCAANIAQAVRVVNSRLSDPIDHPTDRGAAYVDYIVRVGSDIAAALGSTHRQGYCHFDIKPTNVLLCQDGTARLIDFNLAAVAAQQASRGGTVPYMSPEQLRHHLNPQARAGEGPPSDIFSLGVLLYEMLTGRHPFRSFAADQDRQAAAEELLRLHQRPVRRLREWNPRVDRRLETIVLQCLSHEPSARPDADRLHAELRRALSRPRQAARWLLDHPRGVRWSVAAAVILAVGAGWSVAVREPAADRALRQAEAAFLAGDIAQAEQAYTAAITGKATSAEAWFQRGLCRLNRKSPDEAYGDFLESRRLAGDARSAAYAGYCLCLAQKDWRQAIALLDEAKRLGASAAGIEHDLAYCHLMLQQLEPAERCLQACLAMEPVAAETYYLAGKLHHQLGFTARPRRSVPEQIEHLTQARDHFVHAIESGYATGDVYLDAAVTQASLCQVQGGPLADAASQVKQFLVPALRNSIDARRMNEVKEAYPQLAGLLKADALASDREAISPVASLPPVLAPCWPSRSATTFVATR